MESNYLYNTSEDLEPLETDMYAEEMGNKKHLKLVLGNDPNENVEDEKEPQDENEKERNYIGNKNTKKFHYPTCSYLPDEKNRVYFEAKNDC